MAAAGPFRRLLSLEAGARGSVPRRRAGAAGRPQGARVAVQRRAEGGRVMVMVAAQRLDPAVPAHASSHRRRWAAATARIAEIYGELTCGAHFVAKSAVLRPILNHCRLATERSEREHAVLFIHPGCLAIQICHSVFFVF